MKKNLLILLLLIATAFSSQVLSQQYSVRTNILNAFAKGPSITFGKQINKHNQLLVTYSFGKFAPFFFDDYYKYATANAEYRWEGKSYSKFIFYYGGYLRYIHKRIVTEGYTAGPYGIFSKASRDFTGNGISAGLTSGVEWLFDQRWFLEFNTLYGAGKYLSQVDYSGHDKIPFFLDTRIALQVGFRF